MLKNIACKTLLLISCSIFASESWVEFRGPNNGHANVKTLPLKWTKTENIKWRTEFEGKAWSSPIFYKEKLYLSNAVEKDGQVHLSAMCLDAQNGKLLWQKDLFTHKEPRIHSKNSHASPTPIIEADKLYIHFGYQGTACLDLTGKVIWKNKELFFEPMHGNGGSPAIIEDMMVFHCDGSKKPSIAALDKKTGKLRWRTFRNTEANRKFSFCTPMLIEESGRKLIISPASGAVFAYDLKGKEVWRFDYGQGYSVVPKPIYAHGLIYVSSGYDKPVAYCFSPKGTGNITKTNLKWSKDTRDAPRNSSMIIVGDELYMQSDRGTITCMDAKTGEIHYQQKRVIRTSSASPIYALERIYFTDESGKTAVIAPGKEYK